MTENAAIVFHLPLIAVLVALLCLSAFFSASEAAYFSISRSALLELEGRTRRERMVPELLRDPRMLLVTILFGNLLVNIAATSVVTALAIARQVTGRYAQTAQAPAARLLEALVQAELDERARRRLERQLRAARLGRFKAMADFEWDWPKQLHRPTVERVFKEYRGVRVLRVRGRSGSEDGQCASAE